MAYGGGIDPLMHGGLGAPPPPAVLGAGLGAPPGMPGLPPPPTGLGPIPVGNPATDKKAAADEAVLKLRDASAHFPALKPQIDAMVDALKSATAAPGPPPPPPPSASPMPGAPTPEQPDLEDSGGPGPM